MIPLDSDESLDQAEDAFESDKTIGPDKIIKFEPYPMLPATPPVALLAGSIREEKQHDTEEVDNWLVSIRNHHV